MTSTCGSRSSALEQDYVHRVYERIGGQLSGAPDPLRDTVRHFLDELEPGSLVADIGCGDGRHLVSPGAVFSLGAERSPTQASLARARGHQALLADALRLPCREEAFDAALSLGVIHHLSTRERRVRALRQVARLLRVGGRALISVRCHDPRRFSQDVLMPWYDIPAPKESKGGDAADYSSSDDDSDSISLSSSDEEEAPAPALIADRFAPRNTQVVAEHTGTAAEVCYSFVRRALRRLSSIRSGEDARKEDEEAPVDESSSSSTPPDESLMRMVSDNYIELMNIDDEVEMCFDPPHRDYTYDETTHTPEPRPKLARSVSDFFKRMWTRDPPPGVALVRSRTTVDCRRPPDVEMTSSEAERIIAELLESSSDVLRKSSSLTHSDILNANVWTSEDEGSEDERTHKHCQHITEAELCVRKHSELPTVYEDSCSPKRLNENQEKLSRRLRREENLLQKLFLAASSRKRHPFHGQRLSSKTLCPFHDTSEDGCCPEDESTLSSYYSMPELHKLCEFQKEYEAYRADSSFWNPVWAYSVTEMTKLKDYDALRRHSLQATCGNPSSDCPKSESGSLKFEAELPEDPLMTIAAHPINGMLHYSCVTCGKYDVLDTFLEDSTGELSSSYENKLLQSFSSANTRLNLNHSIRDRFLNRFPRDPHPFTVEEKQLQMERFRSETNETENTSTKQEPDTKINDRIVEKALMEWPQHEQISNPKCEVSGSSSAANKLVLEDEQVDSCYGRVDDERATVALHRYHHLFRERELEELIENYVSDLHIQDSFRFRSHWCAIVEKVRVWTI